MLGLGKSQTCDFQRWFNLSKFIKEIIKRKNQSKGSDAYKPTVTCKLISVAPSGNYSSSLAPALLNLDIWVSQGSEPSYFLFSLGMHSRPSSPCRSHLYTDDSRLQPSHSFKASTYISNHLLTFPFRSFWVECVLLEPAYVGSREPILGVSSQVHVQCPRAGEQKSAMTRVFTPWKLADATKSCDVSSSFWRVRDHLRNTPAEAP